MVVGRFAAAPHDPDFATSGRVGARPAIAFSRTAVRIAPAGRPAFVSDPTLAVLHNPEFPYTRQRVDPRGDHCLWISFSRELLGALDPDAAARSTPFGPSHVPIDAAGHLLLQRFARGLAARPLDPLFVEDTALALLARVVGPAPRLVGGSLRQARLVDDVKGLLVACYDRRVTVSEIARAVGCSPFHMSRVFRAATGYTVHRYLTELRLRAGLERLLAGADDVTTLALDLGFSSHSHFTAAFRATFGITPSQARAGGLA